MFLEEDVNHGAQCKKWAKGDAFFAALVIRYNVDNSENGTDERAKKEADPAACDANKRADKSKELKVSLADTFFVREPQKNS